MTESFAIIPAQSRSLWFLAGFIVLMLTVVLGGVTTLMVATARGAYLSRFEVSADGLRLRGDLYGRMIPASAIRGASVRVVDLGRVPELAPRRRTAGTAVGGYQAGWFRLANGEKALLYLTERSRVVYVPTTAGYSVLLSAQSPEQLAVRLRAIGGA